MSELNDIRDKIERIDREMARLFEERMRAASEIAEFKAKNRMPVRDTAREAVLTERNLSYIEDPRIRELYRTQFNTTLSVSRAYQERVIEQRDASRASLHIELGDRSYTVHLKAGGLDDIDGFFNLDRKVLIITDRGVPAEYSQKLLRGSGKREIFVLPEGEEAKTLGVLKTILSKMIRLEMTRADCIVAVGGGAVSDVAGLAAATYMRGIDFYTVPTTLLSMVDASVGGKVAINFSGYKNQIGAFYQPKGVLIDTKTLDTLPKRQITSGMAEVIKAALLGDERLVEYLEKTPVEVVMSEGLEYIIYSALRVKRDIVEEDERENGKRALLNLGHSLGHAIEAVKKGELLHGECVAVGIPPVCEKGIRERVCALLERYGLSTKISLTEKELISAINSLTHDKKATRNGMRLTVLDGICKPRIETVEHELLKQLLHEAVKCI